MLSLQHTPDWSLSSFWQGKYTDTILTETGLVSYWKLDENGGTTACDSISNNHGTYNGGYTQGKDSGLNRAGTLFNGTTGYVTVPTASSLHPTTAMSLEAWINIATLDSSYHTIAGTGFTNNTSPFIDYELSVDNSGSNKIVFSTGTGGTFTQTFAVAASVASTWYHVVGTYNGTTQILYVNGVQVASAALSGSLNSSGQSFNIGRSVRGASILQFFNGTIDEVALYNVALSAAQVSNHYISDSTVNLRLTQEPVRTLVLPTDANLRLTQEPVRTLVFPTDANLRLTQEPVRTLVFPTDANLLLTQMAVRTLRLNGGGMIIVSMDALRSMSDLTGMRSI